MARGGIVPGMPYFPLVKIPLVMWRGDISPYVNNESVRT
jgi:hypothetical protein